MAKRFWNLVLFTLITTSFGALMMWFWFMNAVAMRNVGDAYANTDLVLTILAEIAFIGCIILMPLTIVGVALAIRRKALEFKNHLFRTQITA